MNNISIEFSKDEIFALLTTLDLIQAKDLEEMTDDQVNDWTRAFDKLEAGYVECIG